MGGSEGPIQSLTKKIPIKNFMKRKVIVKDGNDISILKKSELSKDRFKGPVRIQTLIKKFSTKNFMKCSKVLKDANDMNLMKNPEVSKDKCNILNNSDILEDLVNMSTLKESEDKCNMLENSEVLKDGGNISILEESEASVDWCNILKNGDASMDGENAITKPLVDEKTPRLIKNEVVQSSETSYSKEAEGSAKMFSSKTILEIPKVSEEDCKTGTSKVADVSEGRCNDILKNSKELIDGEQSLVDAVEGLRLIRYLVELSLCTTMSWGLKDPLPEKIRDSDNGKISVEEFCSGSSFVRRKLGFGCESVIPEDILKIVADELRKCENLEISEDGKTVSRRPGVYLLDC